MLPADFSLAISNIANSEPVPNSSITVDGNDNASSPTPAHAPPPPQPGSLPEKGTFYGRLSDQPTQEAPHGIYFDFNDGIRVKFPSCGGPWRICFRDLDTGVILYNQNVKPDTFVTSVKKFYIRFRLEIYSQQDIDCFEEKRRSQGPYRPIGEDGKPSPLEEPVPFFTHDYDARGKSIMIQLPVGTIGDAMGWFPYVEKFRRLHECQVLAVMEPHLADLVRNQYPEIVFITREQVKEYSPYACYYLGLFFKGNVDNQPCDFRYVGLHRTAGYILGVDPTEEPPKFDLSAPRKIDGPYVCIAAQSSSQAKYWNNPFGWREVVAFLKENGYRVLCIDRDPVYGIGIHHNSIPFGCEDFTGAIPLQERVNLIKDADFFIGLSSGLSWVAWGCGVPVVMISGFTHPTNEFYTPFRVINFHTCNSCWNDMRVDFDHFDYLWCPKHKGTDRHFECTRLISGQQVIDTVKKIPAFQKRTS